MPRLRVRTRSESPALTAAFGQKTAATGSAGVPQLPGRPRKPP
jgi:hypothetical protein